MPYKCCVANCSAKDVMLHMFPKDMEMCRKWCVAIVREDLMGKIQTVQKYYRVCDMHFDEQSKFPDNRNRTNLKVSSIPCLHLPACVDVQTSSSSSNIAMVEGVYEVPEAGGGVIVEGEPESEIPGGSLEREGSDAIVTAVKDVNSVICDTSREEAQGINPTVSNKKPTSKLKGNILRKKRNLLLEVNLQKKAQLTPKATKLYNIAKEFRDIGRKLDHEAKTYKEKLKTLTQKAEDLELYHKKINSATFRFLQSQITQQGKMPRGRRYSREDKLLALSLLKQSPRAYRLLQKNFALPSRKTLIALLKKVPFESGINRPIFRCMQESVKKLSPRDRHCILLFDEMSLQPALSYNKFGGHIDGFQSTSGSSIKQIADHTMVFMVVGLGKKWKQPVAYFFSQNGMKNEEVAKNVKDIIIELNNIGLIVDSTVCDQYNKAAVNYLVEETKRNQKKNNLDHDSYTFFIGDNEVLPLFDFPHLLKGIRNNMLNYNVHFIWKGDKEVASWNHIEALYKLDNDDQDFRMLPKLTDEHIVKGRIKKMKVKHAAQIFSHSVQSTMRGLIKHGNTMLPKEAIGTANFLLFVDKLFDSVNGSSINPKDNKPLRRAVTQKTGHMDFWDEAIKVLTTVKFFNAKREFVPPSLTNWILTLKNLKRLWRKLQAMDFEFLLPRSLNQDPLENFFSIIRSHGARNINPSCTNFKAAFKTLILNNFMAVHSIGANCEEDLTEGALCSLQHFLSGELSEEIDMVPLNYAADKVLNLTPVNGHHTLMLHGYMTGYMAKKILRLVGYCKTCRRELITSMNDTLDEHMLIQSRAYNSNCLLKPRTKFVVLFGLCTQVLTYFLPRLCNERQLQSKLYLILSANISNNIFAVCPEHDIYKQFLQLFIDLFCFTWTTNVSKILRGQILPGKEGDPIKKQALSLHNKYRSKLRKVRQFKQLQN